MTSPNEIIDPVVERYGEFLTQVALDNEGSEEILVEVFAELIDLLYLHRQHGKRATYITAGCRGPLCRKSERDFRRLFRYRTSVEQRAIRRPVADRRWDELLETVQEFHSNYWKATHAA